MGPRATTIRFGEEATQQYPSLMLIDAGVRIPPLYAQLIVQWLADDIEDRLLRRTQCPLRVAQDLASEQLRLLQELFMRNVFRALFAWQRSMRVDRRGGENLLAGPAHSADVHQRGNPTVAVMEP